MRQRLDSVVTWTILGMGVCAAMMWWNVVFSFAWWWAPASIGISGSAWLAKKGRLVGHIFVGVCLGLCAGHLATTHTHNVLNRMPTHTTEVLCGTAQRTAVTGPKGLTLDLALTKPYTATLWVSRSAHEDGMRRSPLPGDFVCAEGAWQPHQPRMFPWQRQRARVARSQGHVGVFIVEEALQWSGREDGVMWTLRRHLARRRIDLESRLFHLLPPARVGLATAMLTGNKAPISRALRQPFDRTNTSHILAISGLHLGTLALVLWWVLSRLMIALAPDALCSIGLKRVLGPTVCAIMGAYVLMVGAPTSALRALWMLSALCVAHTTRSRIDPLRALCMACVALVAWEPWVMFEVGFQLSVSATAGILLYWRAQSDALNNQHGSRLLRRVRQTAGVSLCAGLSTLPLILELAGEWSVVSVALNLVVTPLVSIAVFPLMLAGALASFVSMPSAQVLLHAALEMMWTLRQWCLWGVEVAPSPWRPGHIHVLGVVAATGCAWATIRLSNTHKYLSCVALLMGALLLMMPGQMARHHQQQRALTWHSIPVGQGDSTLLLTQGKSVLIDGGGAMFGRDPGATYVMPMLRYEGIDRLDAVILTHPDLDHMGGLWAVLQDAPPRHFYYNLSSASHPTLRAMLQQLRAQGVTLHPLSEGTHALEGAPLTLWVPSSEPTTQENDKSVVVDLNAAGVRGLITGDLEAHGEHAWRASHTKGRVHILKAGHHGSKTSSTDAFVHATRPHVALISCGARNRFGHPHPTVVRRLQRAGASIWRTDTHGLVTIDIEHTGRWRVRTMQP